MTSTTVVLQRLWQHHRRRHPVTMATPIAFYTCPVGLQTAAIPAPQPPRYLKHDVYCSPSVFDAVDRHAIDVRHVDYLVIDTARICNVM